MNWPSLIKGRSSTFILHTTSFDLVFHDCVGSDGCDGCLNLNNPDNHGFEAVVEFLAKDRDDNFPVFTLETDQNLIHGCNTNNKHHQHIL